MKNDRSWIPGPTDLEWIESIAAPIPGALAAIDPDRTETDLARGWWREAGLVDERIAVVNVAALRP